MNKATSDATPSPISKRHEKDGQKSSSSGKRQVPSNTTCWGSKGYAAVTNGKASWVPKRSLTDISHSNFDRKHNALYGVTNSDCEAPVDVSRLTDDLTKMIFQNEDTYCPVKRDVEFRKVGGSMTTTDHAKGKKATAIDETQTQQIKKILVNCLQNMDRNLDESSKDKHDPKIFCRKSYGKIDKYLTSDNSINSGKATSKPATSETSTKTSLLRSYLSGSNPPREEYISKRKNVSNSMISSDSIHHSIFLESGRERRQCLLQYLTNVINDGQVVIYVNSIPASEALLSFLKKHGFDANYVHSKLLLAESNWILSQFSQKKYSVLICAEDHYHSCPAHFRWVKTIINYELPICNPIENWSIRNGIVEFSDNLPVHIYTFIKKSCQFDYDLVKALHLDFQDDQDQDVQIER